MLAMYCFIIKMVGYNRYNVASTFYQNKQYYAISSAIFIYYNVNYVQINFVFIKIILNTMM